MAGLSDFAGHGLVGRGRRLRNLRVLASIVLVALAAVAYLAVRSIDDARRIGVPVVLPVYEIEAVSNGRQARLLNLPLPYVGAPQIPVPVDINGDLLPDVTVSVNLVNAEGVFNNPPKAGEVIAPNVEINRLVTAPILTPGGDPLKINAKLTIKDVGGSRPDRVIRFGYDTGDSGRTGTIPPAYKALLGGLETFFNPVDARIDTTGGLVVGLDPKTTDLGITPQSAAYEGPLTTFASFDDGPESTALVDLRFKPQPDLVQVKYRTDDANQHVEFAHSSQGEVDLQGRVEIKDGTQGVKAKLQLDRLPREVSVDFNGDLTGGALSYQSSSASGRLPDLRAEIAMDGVIGNRPLVAEVDAESLPDELAAEWDLRPGKPPSVTFDGSGQGIGAIEARLRNFQGRGPAGFTEWVPQAQQYASIQVAGADILEDDTLVLARLERIRHASIQSTEAGEVSGTINVGDGERPLQVHAELDLREDDGPYIDATALISPLPEKIDFNLVPGATAADPLTVVYQPSETVDVHTTAKVILPDIQFSDGGELKEPEECEDPGTVCADVSLFNVPIRIEARLLGLESESRVEVDAIPRPGGAPVDLFVDAVLGPVTDLPAPIDILVAAPIHAEVNVQGLPRFARFRAVEDESQNVSRVDIRTCDVNWATNTCETGTEGEEVAELDFAVRNFDLADRPADLPPPPQSGPLFVTVGGQGLPDRNDRVHFEATGRFTDFKQLTYLGAGDLTAVKVDLGGNKDFRAFVDVDHLDLNGGDPADGRVDVDADVRIQSLPAPLTFCLAQPGRPLTRTPLDPITARCETDDPFGDGAPPGIDDPDQKIPGPLSIAYEAPGPFSVIADAAIQGDLPVEQPDLPLKFGEFDRVSVHHALTNIAGQFTGRVQTPADSDVVDRNGDSHGATRVLTVAPGASDTRFELQASLTTPGVRCEDPDPVGGAVCASVVVDRLPEFVSVLADTVTRGGAAPGGAPAVIDRRGEFHACDFDFFATNSCRPDTEGSIGSIDVDVRAHAGSPSPGVPTYVPPADQPHVAAQADLDDLANFEAEASVRVEDVRHIVFRQDSEGLEVRTDVGSGAEPLTVHAFADVRDTTNLVPGALRAAALADVVLDPVPRHFSFTQTGPGHNQVAPMVIEAAIDGAVSAPTLTANAEIRQAGSGPDCGDRGTACASVVVDQLPKKVTATLTRSFGPIASDERDISTNVLVDQERFDPADPDPNIRVAASIGLPQGAPVIGDGPVFAELNLTGVPEHLSMNIDNHEVLAGGTNKVVSSAVERFQFHTCRRDFANEVCEPGTEDAIDLIEASVRTFDLRPTDFPTPPTDAAPMYAGVAGRGAEVETYVRIPEISEVQFLNRDGVTAAKARVTGSTPTTPRDFDVRVDIQDLPLADLLDLGALRVERPVVDLNASLDITPFPGDLAFCLRNGGQSPVPAPSSIPFTQTCEDTQPFGQPLTHAPLSIGFHSNVDFDVAAHADVSIDGFAPGTNNPVARQRFVGDVGMTDLPRDLVFHFLQPRQTQQTTSTGGTVVQPGGPLRGRLEVPGATSGLDVRVSAAYLVGPDTICKDPRRTVSATCFSAEILDLPTEVDFFYDPDLDLTDPSVDLTNPSHTTNFLLRTNGPSPTQINDLDLSVVNPPLDLPSVSLPMLGEISTDVVIVEADLDNIPQPFDLRGTLALQDDAPTAVFEVQNGNSLPGAQIHVRNFISPDPTMGAFVPNRPVGTNTLATYPITAIQRGPFVKIDADIIGVRSFGLRPVRSAVNRAPLGTNALTLGFAEDFNVRAFVDLMPEPGTRLLGDVLVENIPARTEICLRSPRKESVKNHAPVAGTGTWCDSSTFLPEEGALEVAQVPNLRNRKMNVDAFARVEFGGGSTVLAGRADIDQLPQVVRARYGGRDVEVNAYSRVFGTGTLVPDGPDRVKFEAASFDLAQSATGIVGALPYSPAANANPPFPAKAAPADGREYLHAAADLSAGIDLSRLAFHVRGQLGRTDGAPSSQLHHFLYSSKPCPTPPNNPTDYPRMPTNDNTGYTCVLAEFDAASAGTNPLSLDAVALLPGGDAVKLREAGISDIPAWVQFQLAKAEIYTDPTNKRGWRRPCPARTSTDTASCMAPLVRFDQPDNPFVFGVADYGKLTDLPALDNAAYDAKGPAPDFDSIPTGTGWDSAFATGVRAKVLDFDGGTLTDFADDRIAARAAFRLAIPQSLTVDQVQTFSQDLFNDDEKPTAGSKAEDLRLRVLIANSAGQVVNSLGQVAVMAHLVDSGAQLLLTKPCPDDVAASDATEPRAPCAEYGQGIDLPGELAATVYMRDHLTLVGDKLRSSKFIQVDGKISTPISIGARLFGGGAELTDGISLGTAEVAIRNVPAYSGVTSPHDPSFRLRTEIVEDGPKPEQDDESDTASGSASGQDSDPSVPWVEFLMDYSVGIKNAIVGFDFNPTGTPARRLDAVVYLELPRLGADVAGYANLAGTAPAEVSVGAGVILSPLDFNLRSKVNFIANVNDIIDEFITETLGAPWWLSKVIQVIVSPITASIQALLDLLPLQVRLQSDLTFQFSVSKLDRFTLRNNILHAVMDGEGSGFAKFGPLNWYIDEFSGGIDLDVPPIKIPKWICWVPGVPCTVDPPPILMLGYSYLEGIPAGSLGLPILLDYRDCDAAGGFGSIVPFGGGGFDNAVMLDPAHPNDPPNLVEQIIAPVLGEEDFVIWVGTDPRMSAGGLVTYLLPAGPVVTRVLDVLIDLAAGPILCNVDFFSVAAAKYVGINTATTNQAQYHPGNIGVTTFAGHPVPGQPGQPATLPEQQPPPTTPVVFPPRVTPAPPVTPPLTPPQAPAPLYAGPDRLISSPVALCGVHEFDDLTVRARIDVATTANAADLVGTGQACPAGAEGTLELRANTIDIAATGEINARAISNDVPDFGTDRPLYRATGSSGGSNAGVGFNGTAPEAGLQNYLDATSGDLLVYPGGPGSSTGSFSDPDVAVPNPIPSAGAGGRGGGAVVLRADRLLNVAGSVIADGGDGASNTGGACDDNPDDFNGAGVQQYDHDGDPETDPVDRPIVDPPYEHDGFIGAGGGAGGAVALEARTEVNVTGTGTLRARGGAGGSGRLGLGGAGGGGAIKVIAPIVGGVTQAALDTATRAGANPATGVLCAGIDGTSEQTFDDPTTAATETGPLPEDGFGLIVSRPSASLLPYGPFWRPGGPGAPAPGTFDAYFVGAGGPDTVTVHTCAVYLSTTATYDNDNNASTAEVPVPTADAALAALMNKVLPRVEYVGDTPVQRGTPPTALAPCGGAAPNPITGESITSIRTSTFAGAVTSPTTYTLDIDTTGFYGLYTTAVRSGQVEPLGTVEWVVRVDANRPTASLTAPAAGTVFTVGAAQVQFTAADQPALSGVDRTECRTTGGDWRTCSSGDFLELLQPDGTKNIDVRAFDKAGNVSTTSTVQVVLDQNPPSASAQLLGGVQGGAGWYRQAPSLRLFGYSAAAPPGNPPYVYRFDNGAEDAPTCPRPGGTGPLDCHLPATAVDAALATGVHSVHYTAVNSVGVRYRDDLDPTTPTPMPSLALKLDTDAPVVELATVPAEPNRTHLGAGWFDVQPYLVVSAVDQFGGSGLSSLEISLNGGATYSPYNPLDPPRAPTGVRLICVRATDVAGNVGVAPCTTIRVDDTAPSFNLTPSGGPDGLAGWYVTRPTFTVGGYNDGSGVGIDGNRFRYRVDNDFATDCDPVCTIGPSRFDTGRHLVHASATDRFGNRTKETTREVRVDLEAPLVTPVINPSVGDGANGWWRTQPFLSFFAQDPNEGSGVAGIEYSLDGGATYQAWTEPITVGPGPHQLCWRATDVAGNTSKLECRSFRIDLHDPTASLTPDGSHGWSTALSIPVTINSGDVSPGSTVNPALDPDRTDLCEDLTPAPNPITPSGTCVAVDGGPFVPLTGPISLSEGRHVVRAFSVDVAGRRSAVAEGVYTIDNSPPVAVARLLPPDPARSGWYRRTPRVVLRADDGHDSSGVATLEYRMNSSDPAGYRPYTGPFVVPEGVNTVTFRVTDRAGLSREGTAVVPVDVTPPKVQALWAQADLLSGTVSRTETVYTGGVSVTVTATVKVHATTPPGGGGCGPKPSVPVVWTTTVNSSSSAKLCWRLGDNLSGPTRVAVIVYDATGNVARRLDGGTVNLTPGVEVEGYVTWDGRDTTLLNHVPAGAYHYRVVAVDSAGNAAQSGESAPVLIRLG